MIRILTSLLFLPLLLAVIGMGCASKPTRNVGNQMAVDSITLERTPCFGRCPVYRIVIHGDGRVEYDGINNVAVTGHAESRLSSRQLEELTAALDSVDYFSLRDSYTNRDDGCPLTATDQPFAKTSVTMGSRTKTIDHYYGCMEPEAGAGSFSNRIYPIELTTFELRIDEIVGITRWVGSKSR